MKKLRKAITVFAILAFGFGLMLNTQTSMAEENESGSWICCKVESDGCEDILGNTFPEDERYEDEETCDDIIINN